MNMENVINNDDALLILFGSDMMTVTRSGRYVLANEVKVTFKIFF